MSPDVRDILLVDDNPANLTAIEVGLGDLGRRVVRAASGEDALRRLLELDFSLILLDVQMPTLDGFQTARLIRQRPRSRGTPIIFMTAFDCDDKEVLRAYELGAVDFLFKPVVPEILRSKASVFVNLQIQAELIRESVQKDHERQLAAERARWEEESLRQRIDDARRVAEETARRARELSATVNELEDAKLQLTRVNEELATADRRKDEFLAVLAHELRNPLAPLLTHLELLGMRATESADVGLQRTVETMDRQVGHLNRVVDDLLDVSRITTGDIQLVWERVDLSDVIQQACNIARPLLATHQHQLVVSLTECPMFVKGDSVRLTQIVANLLNNAARYSDPKGRISLTLRQEADEAAIRVEDRGRGIAANAQERIFEMFTQERRGGGGLGVGLALARRLVSLHQGTISVASEGLGKGSVFKVLLPALKDDAPSPQRPAACGAEAALATLHIVLVEDDVDIRQAMLTLLQRWGHHVEVADTGPRGLDLILKAVPDVAVIDLGLPELDGCEVAQRVRDVLPKERVCLMAMTGFGRKEDRHRALAAGFDVHLVKPASARSIAKALADVPRH